VVEPVETGIQTPLVIQAVLVVVTLDITTKARVVVELEHNHNNPATLELMVSAIQAHNPLILNHKQTVLVLAVVALALSDKLI
jgi:hypothetical protein